MQMFKSAQIKLTSWYLAIIMLVTISFSSFVYMAVSQATTQALEVQRRRVERYFVEYGDGNSFTYKYPNRFPNNFDAEALLEIKEKTFYFLIMLNLGIFVASGTLGYFLAGKTLNPIKDMINSQKRFISDAAHEFKTPLTAIKTNLEVAMRDKNLCEADAKDVFSSTLEEIDKLTYISNQLLQKSKYQNSLNHKEFKEVDLYAVLNSIMNKLTNVAKKKDIIFVNKTTPIKIYGNKEDLDALFTNLIENAIKYSHNNSQITVANETKKQICCIKVIDQGVGISKEDLPNIFEPFFRAEKSRNKTKASGYGLGLSIAKEIVENHKGRISVSSKLDSGTKFTVCLPEFIA